MATTSSNQGASSTQDASKTSAIPSINDQETVPTWTQCNPRRFLGDDDRLREFSSFFAHYFDSSHPQRDPADSGTTQLISIDKQLHADLFNHVATEFKNHCRSPDDYEIVKVELLRNKVLWKRYQAEKAVRRELEAETFTQQKKAYMSAHSNSNIASQKTTTPTTTTTSTTPPQTSNPSYEAALKRMQEAGHNSSGNSTAAAAGTHDMPPKTAYFDAILFHGTKTSSVPSILANGLDPRTTTRSNYGRGIYFSDTIEKCMHFVDTQTSYDQVYSILLCCVVLGNALINPFDKEQGHIKNDTLFLPPGFDSVCEMNPLKEFVVFEKTQILPLCVVSIKASNLPTSFWRICHPALHSYPPALHGAQTHLYVNVPEIQHSPPTTQPPQASTSQTAHQPSPGGFLPAVPSSKPLSAIPPLEELGLVWEDITYPEQIAAIGSSLDLRPDRLKKATAYLYGVLYTLIAGIANGWGGPLKIIRIPADVFGNAMSRNRMRYGLELKEKSDCEARTSLITATEHRLQAEFDRNPSMHQLYPSGKMILMEMDRIKQELANFPAARQTILEASAGQPAHLVHLQLQHLQNQQEKLLARQIMLLNDAKKFTLEQQQWIIAMVEEETKLAQMREAHINAVKEADHKLRLMAQEVRSLLSSSMITMTLHEIGILVAIAENARNGQRASGVTYTFSTPSNNPATGTSTTSVVTPPLVFRRCYVTCAEAEAWPQMIAELIMSRVLISKIQPTTFQLLLSQIRKVNPFSKHPQVIQVAGSDGPRLFVAKKGWWYDAPRQHFKIPIAASRFWPIDPRSRLPNRSFQKLEDYLLWAITKTEKRKLTLARKIESNKTPQMPLFLRAQQKSAQETLRQIEKRVQEEFEALDPSIRFAIAGLSAVSGRVVFSRKKMEAFLEKHEANLVSSLFIPATPEMLTDGSECSVCLVAFNTAKVSSQYQQQSSNTYDKANGVVQLDDDSRVVKLKCCRHCFHETCITSWFHAPSAILKCPVCSVSCLPQSRPPHSLQDTSDDEEKDGGKSVFPKLGPAPDGVMGYIFDPRMCAYYVWFTMQSHNIVNPNGGMPAIIHVSGDSRYAIIPFSARLGPLLLIRMIVAFKFGHMFRVGRSLSRNVDNVITWNGIHCRTSLINANGFGFPQPEYEANAWQEIDQKHIAMSLTPLLERFLGPQVLDKAQPSSAFTSVLTASKSTESEIVMTTIGTGSTAARSDMFDGEDRRELEMEMYDCEYYEDEEIKRLDVSAPAVGLSSAANSNIIQPQIVLPPQNGSNTSSHHLQPQSQQQQQQEPNQTQQNTTFDHWLDPSVNYFYTHDKNRKDYDRMASEHAKKIEHAIQLHKDRGMATDKAIESVMNVVAGYNENTNLDRNSNSGTSSSPHETRLPDNEQLAYKSHMRFFDPRCPLMFG
ncbi:putative E3 ubiquitin-protein ligase dtx2 [Actinomortierella wolfii]|nr:putative E3 ubiquitin-protein ligase dtx2 [Actinomortierella wolfii]